MKKYFFSLAIAILAIIAANPAEAYYSPQSGDLIKKSGASAIYYVDSSYVRHLFPNEATFFSWYNGSWSDYNIKTISEYDFNQLTSGRNVTLRPGSRLMRFDNSLIMYAVLPGGKLCHASYNYNNYQYNRAAVIPSSYESDYYNDGVCDISYNSNLPDGSLIQYSGSSEIYYIQNGSKRHVTTSGYSGNRFRYESVITNVSNSMAYADGAVLEYYDNTISDIAYYLNNVSYTSYNYYSGSYYNYANYTCTENWVCGSYGSCSNGWQYRTCYDSNNCGTVKNKPTTAQYCYNYNYNYNYYYSCTENWSCGSWGTCSGGWQYRSCYDRNNCGTTYSKPSTSQSCYSYNYLCTPNWTCGAWSTCAYGNQSRSCWDSNNCNSTYNKPVTSQSCASCTESWSCGSWGTCQGSSGTYGWQYRSCYDRNNCGTSNNKPTTSQTCYRCSENWSCTSWTGCSNGYRTRSCVDINSCSTSNSKPSTTQYCY